MSRKKQGVIEAAMRNRNIVMILSVVIMIIGAIALKKMPRNEFPQFTIRQGVIVGVYPGATSAEVEAQLTRIVENYIFGYQEVKKAKTYSHSKEGIMYIFVELNDNVKNADQFWSKLKHGLNDLKMTLPSGVMALVANSDFGDTSALLITLSSDTKSYKELEEELKKLEAECRKIPATSKIKHFGLQKESIYVNVKPEKLNEYNIKSLSLLSQYQSNGMVNYAGMLKDGQSNLAVHLPPNFESEKDLADQIVYSDPQGNVVRLKNIASIERRYQDPDNYIKQNGMKTILLSLEMQPGNNIVEFGADVDKALQKFQKQVSGEIKVAKISELPKYVDDSVTNFMHEFLIAIIAVVLVTMVLLPFRVASVAGITVPISVLLTLAVLYFVGVELHTVSLASLILVLGMIVDNSIVVIDNHVERIDHGLSPWYAAIVSAKELVAPIITATLAIMAAYIPLGFMVPGTAGEFMNTIPIVVGVALIVSVVVALYLVPYLNFVFIKKGLKHRKSEKSGNTFLDVVQAWFDKSLEKAFHYRKTVIAVGVGFVVLAIVLFKTTDQQLFPEMERNQFAVEVYLPTGTALERTAMVVDSLEKILLKDKRVTNVTSFIGTSSPRFHTVYAPNMPATNYGQLLINTVSEKATRAIVNEYSPIYADHFVNAHVKWKILAMQVAKSPIEIRISSDSIKDIRKTENEIYQLLKTTKGVGWVRTDWDQRQQGIRVNLERDKANRMGYSKGLVSTSLMVGLDGVPLTTIWENDYPVDVKLTQETDGKKGIKTLEDQYITSPSSYSANPLRSFATLAPEWTEGNIVRRNGVPTLTIQVDNEANAIASNIMAEITPKIEKMALPEGTSIMFGGDYEGQIEVFVPMGIALGLSIVLIFFILLFEFKKIKFSLLIMSTMLLSLPGAAIGLKITGYPFSITAFIGITSLCGMVVRNGIILIDYARELVEKKRMPILEAAIAAGKRRMRPIFLTSAAASAGVVPMILSKSPLWGPLGTVICFGLLLSMALTLYVLPVLYSLVYHERKGKSGFWSVPEKTTLLVIGFLCFQFIPMQAQSLSLDSCKKLAINNNRKIKQADLEVGAAIEEQKNAFTNYFPKASASVTLMRSPEPLIKGKTPEMNLPVYDGNPANLQAATQFAYVPSIPINALKSLNAGNVMLALPLYAGGRIYTGNKLAAIGTEISKNQKAITTTDVLVRTEEMYWTLISLQEKKKTLHSYQVLLDTLFRDVKNYLQAGLVQRSDLLKVQLKQNELELNLVKLDNGIDLTSKALCQHIGINGDGVLNLTTKPIGSPVLPLNPPEKNSATARTEYQLLTRAKEAGELQKRMTRGEYLPQVSVSAVGIFADAGGALQKNTLALLNVSIPISDWWGGAHKIKQQQLKIDKATITLEDNLELMSLQIEQCSNELKESWWAIQVSERSVLQAKENLKVMEDNYKSGATGIADLLEAQATFQNAEDNLIDAQTVFQIKQARYQQSINQYK